MIAEIAQWKQNFMVKVTNIQSSLSVFLQHLFLWNLKQRHFMEK